MRIKLEFRPRMTGWRALRSAGVPPAVLRGDGILKTAGETPALQNLAFLDSWRSSSRLDRPKCRDLSGKPE
jgi:hypothetical protein